MYIHEGNEIKGKFYVVFGTITLALSVYALFAVVACWWLLLAGVIFALIAPYLNEAALQQWIGRSFFGNQSAKYRSLHEELMAYKSAMGG